MSDTISWLLTTNHHAKNIYEKAASCFSGDDNLKLFIDNMAENKAGQYSIMMDVAEHYIKNPRIEPVIPINTDVEKKITEVLDALSSHLDNNTLSESILLESIIKFEFSEWHDIFFSAAYGIKADYKDINELRKNIQNHLQSIELHLENSPDYLQHLKRLKKLKHSWKEKILLVDDEVLILSLLETLLSGDGNIDTALNGKEALEKVKENYYKLIISDINMPDMDGISFFNKSIALYPNLHSRFLFHSGFITDDKLNYFNQKNVAYIEKPGEIKLIRDKAKEILSK